MPKKTKKKGGRVISVDFSGTEKGGRRKIPEGDYLCKVKEVTEEVGENSGQPYLRWVLDIQEPEKYKGSPLYHNTSLQPQALFNLRNLLEAMEVEVPESIANLNLDDYEGLELGVGVELEQYEGKDKPNVVDLFPVADFFSDEEEDDDDEEEDDDDDEEETPDYEDMTLDELKALCKERDIKVPKKAKADKLISLLEDNDEEEEL